MSKLCLFGVQYSFFPPQVTKIFKKELKKKKGNPTILKWSLPNHQVKTCSSFALLLGNVMEKPRVAGQLPSAAAVPGWGTFVWPRAWPQTSADHAFGFPYILWNGERGRRVHLTREGREDWSGILKGTHGGGGLVAEGRVSHRTHILCSTALRSTNTGGERLFSDAAD